MLIKHYYVEKIAHSSYILAGSETCAVIDPSRDVDLYIREARRLNFKITHILETHLHADFISGHIELAQLTGAKIYMPESAKAQFEHIPMKEGDIFELEDMKLQVIETPGHTPEHISYVVTDTARGVDPVAAFVGDTLFVGDVGRPDLFPERADELARKLYDSLFNKLLKLPDFCEVYPAHGAGSLCGKSMGAKYTSTIGYEKKYNATLQTTDIDEFVKLLTNDMPGVPDHFGRSSRLNAIGPKPISQLPKIRLLKPEEVILEMEQEDTILVDVRSYQAFGGLHIPMSYNLDYTGNLPTFAGWILPPDKNIILVAENYEMALDTAIWLYRVGLDNVTGYLIGGLHDWAAKGYAVSRIMQVSPSDYEKMKDEEEIILIDGRDKIAFNAGHIDKAINIPSPDLRNRWQELDQAKSIVVVCNSGVRSSVGISILKQKGFEKLYNLAGGMQGYERFKKM
jgi:hydroxyacylglutathione hydrolase